MEVCQSCDGMSKSCDEKVTVTIMQCSCDNQVVKK